MAAGCRLRRSWVQRRKAELNLGCFIGRGDEYLGLVGGLVIEVGTRREDPRPSTLG